LNADTFWKHPYTSIPQYIFFERKKGSAIIGGWPWMVFCYGIVVYNSSALQNTDIFFDTFINCWVTWFVIFSYGLSWKVGICKKYLYFLFSYYYRRKIKLNWLVFRILILLTSFISLKFKEVHITIFSPQWLGFRKREKLSNVLQFSCIAECRYFCFDNLSFFSYVE